MFYIKTKLKKNLSFSLSFPQHISIFSRSIEKFISNTIYLSTRYNAAPKAITGLLIDMRSYHRLLWVLFTSPCTSNAQEDVERDT